MKRYWSKVYTAFWIILMMLLCTGCSSETKQVDKVKELDFTVVEEPDVPDELMSIINKQKEKPFKLTFTSKGKEYLYIVVGYGSQNTGGYSISVNDLFLSENAVYVDTNLIGPGKDEVVTQVITYPYIVIKTEYIDKNTVFQ
ncbi:hypothetical protein lbkm_3247 [Lachnospiraceae bacterium KM106-2]|nr:hypothetical protein lbkm_3247 [Lachnospiraceae bacterium KM106-2]